MYPFTGKCFKPLISIIFLQTTNNGYTFLQFRTRDVLYHKVIFFADCLIDIDFISRVPWNVWSGRYPFAERRLHLAAAEAPASRLRSLTARPSADRAPLTATFRISEQHLFCQSVRAFRGIQSAIIYDVKSLCTSGKLHNSRKPRWTRYELAHLKIAKSYQIQSMRSRLELQACKTAIPRFRFQGTCACRNIYVRRRLAYQRRPFSPPYQATANNARPSLERACRQSCSTQDIEYTEGIFLCRFKKCFFLEKQKKKAWIGKVKTGLQFI